MVLESVETNKKYSDYTGTGRSDLKRLVDTNPTYFLSHHDSAPHTQGDGSHV